MDQNLNALLSAMHETALYMCICNIMISCTVDFLLYRKSHLLLQTVFNSEIGHSWSNKTEFVKSAANIVAIFKSVEE